MRRRQHPRLMCSWVMNWESRWLMNGGALSNLIMSLVWKDQPEGWYGFGITRALTKFQLNSS
jgi:hypothetical protein